MRYDIAMIKEFCDELCLRYVAQSHDTVAIELEEGVTLVFENYESEDDCIVGFEGAEWHSHGNFMFSDQHGHYIEMDYIDAIAGIVDGRIMICELWERGVLADRWLVHRDYIDEFRHMADGDEVRVRKVTPRSASPKKTGSGGLTPIRRPFVNR